MSTDRPDQSSSVSPGSSNSGNSGALLSISVIKITAGNVLFVGDPKAGAVVAYELGPASAAPGSLPFNIHHIDKRIADLLGVKTDEITICDLAVHPISKEAYIAVERGHAAQAIPVIVRVSQDGTMAPLQLDALPSTRLTLSHPASPDVVLVNGVVARTLSITDLSFHDGELLITGLSNADFSSTLYRARYPFGGSVETCTIEFYHAVHSQNETRAPIETLTVLPLNGEPHVLAVYTCTPLVTLPLSALRNGAHVKGKTIGELGYGNTPIDVLHFQSQVAKGQNQEYVLITHKHRGPMLFSVDAIAERCAEEGMNAPVGFNVVAPPFMSVPMGGVIRVDDQDAHYLCTLRRDPESGSLNLLSFRKGIFFRISDHVSEFMLPGFAYTEAQQGTKQFQDQRWSEEQPVK